MEDQETDVKNEELLEIDVKCDEIDGLGSPLGKKSRKRGEFQCESCRKSFNDKHHLQKHMRIHTQAKPYTCDVCKKTFGRRDHIVQHLRVHSGVQPYSCNICSKTFTWKHNRNLHLKVHSKSPAPERAQQDESDSNGCFMEIEVDPEFVAEECLSEEEEEEGFAFSYIHFISELTGFEQETVTANVRLVSPDDEEKPFACEVCNKHFRRRAHVDQHMRVHSAVASFSCDVCGKAFTWKHNRDLHMRIHSDKRFACFMCSEAFAEKSERDAHVLQEHSSQCLSCEACGKLFAKKSHLLRHARVHTGEAPFSCDVCHKSFKDKNYRDKHLKIHNL